MNLKSILIGIAIIILTSFVVIYGIQTFYESPDYNTYCNETTVYKGEINTSSQCESLRGRWVPATTYANGPKPAAVNVEPSGYCDLYYYCNQEFDNVNKIYSRNLFIITTIIGIILLIIGAILFDLEAVGAGIMGGGVVSLIYGSTEYWRYSGNAMIQHRWTGRGRMLEANIAL